MQKKAVRWAICSSLQTSKPSLTAFLLPFDGKSGSAYQQCLGDPAVSKIACIPKKAIRLQIPDAWQTGVPFFRHAKEDMLLFIVGNFCQPCTFGTRSAAVHAKSPDDIRIHSAMSQKPIANVNTAIFWATWLH